MQDDYTQWWLLFIIIYIYYFICETYEVGSCFSQSSTLEKFKQASTRQKLYKHQAIGASTNGSADGGSCSSL